LIQAEADMKNSKEYSKNIQNLYRTLKHKHSKIQEVNYEVVTDAVVYSIISENMSEKAAESAIKRFTEYFVDLNDLRVSRVEEIVEVLGENTPATREIASRIIRVLQAIFNDYHKVSLEPLKKLGKRPARQVLEKIDGTSNFIVDYCMLTSLRGHAIPLTNKMIKYLKANDLVDNDADEQQISGFLAKQISAKNGYEFYVLLRHESERQKSTAKIKTRTSRRKTAKIKKKAKK
jgi:endonuclease III